MAKQKTAGTTPPLHRNAYAVFVKLWDLGSAVPADTAGSLFNVLDGILLKCTPDDEACWLPSPYGGAVVLGSVEQSLTAAREILKSLTGRGIAASISISWGRFDRVHNVARWNVTALALNSAARMASDSANKGRVVVDPKVMQDAILAKHDFARIFGPAQSGKVKLSEFVYHPIVAKGYTQDRPQTLRLPNHSQIAVSSDIVLFDIERYSQKEHKEQTHLVDALSRSVELAMSTVGVSPSDFGPAGDGGYLAFSPQAGNGSAQAFMFATQLRVQSIREQIPLRIGVSNGPVCSTPRRPVVGGALLQADEVSANATLEQMAVSSAFWQGLPDSLKMEWESAAVPSQPSILRVVPKLPSGQREDRSPTAATIASGTTKRGASALHHVSDKRLTCCHWSSDGTHVHAAGFDSNVYRIDLAITKIIGLPAGRSVIRTLGMSPEWHGLVLGNDAGELLYLSSDQPDELAVRPAAVYAIAAIANRKLIVGDREGTVCEFSLELTGKSISRANLLRVVHRHDGAAFAVCFDKHRENIVSVGADGKLRTSNVRTGKHEEVPVTAGALFSVAVGGGSGAIAIGDSQGCIWVLEDNRRRCLKGHSDTVRTLLLSRSEHWLFSGSKDRTVRCWHKDSGRIWILHQTSDYVYQLALSSSGKQLAVVDGSGSLALMEFPENVDLMSPDDMNVFLSHD